MAPDAWLSIVTAMVTTRAQQASPRDPTSMLHDHPRAQQCHAVDRAGCWRHQVRVGRFGCCVGRYAQGAGPPATDEDADERTARPKRAGRENSGSGQGWQAPSTYLGRARRRTSPWSDGAGGYSYKFVWPLALCVTRPASWASGSRARCASSLSCAPVNKPSRSAVPKVPDGHDDGLGGRLTARARHGGDATIAPLRGEASSEERRRDAAVTGPELGDDAAR
eukprot:scaffold2840_cov379-Prasinococcus_capsulatus_cf.AAC.3